MWNDLLENKIDTNANKNLEQQEVLNFIKDEKNLKELGNYLSKTLWWWTDNLIRISNNIITKKIGNIDKKVRWNQLLSVEEKALMKLKYAIEKKEYPADDAVLNMYLGTNFWNFWYKPNTESVVFVKKTLEKKVESQSLPFLEYKKWYETASINNLLEWAKNNNPIGYEEERRNSTTRNSRKDDQYKDDYIKYDLALYAFDLYSKLVTKKDREIQKKAWYSTEENFTKQWELIVSLSQALEAYKKEKFPTIDATFDKFKKYNDDINTAAKKAGYTTPEKQKESAAVYTIFQKDSMKLVEQYNIQDIVGKIKNPQLSSWANLEEYFGNVNKMIEYTQAYEQLQQTVWSNTIKKYEWYMNQVDTITKKYGVDNIKQWWSDIEKYVAWVTALKNTYHGGTIDRKKYEDYHKLAQNSAIGRYTEWRYGLYKLLQDPANKNSPFRGLKQEAQMKEKDRNRTDTVWQTIKNINPAVYQVLNFWASAWNGVVDFTVWTWSSLGLMLQSTYKNDDERKVSADFKQSFDSFLKFNLSRSQSKPPLDEQWNWNLWVDNTVSQVWWQLANMVALLSGAWAIWRWVTKLWVWAVISQRIGLVSMAFMQQTGRSFEEGKTQWLDDGQALSYSMLQSSIGAGLELISPNQMMMGTGKKVVKEYIKNIIKTETKQSILQVWKVFTKNIVWEVLEENIQETMQLAVGNGINMWANDKWWTKFDANWSMDNFATTALLTTLTTGLWTSKQALSMWVASTQVLSPLQQQDLKQKIISEPVLYGQTTKVLNDIVSGKVQLEWVDIEQMKELQSELKKIESGKIELQSKETKANVEGNNNIEYNSIYDTDKYQYIYNGELMWPDMKDKEILMSIKDQKDKLFTEYRKKEDSLWKQYSNNVEQYTNLRNPIHEQYLKELSELNAKVYSMSWLPLDFQNPVWRWAYGQVFRFLDDPSKLIKIWIIPEYESIHDIQKIINVWKKINNPRLWLPIAVIDLWKWYYAQIMNDITKEHISKELSDLSDEEAALQLYQDAKALKKEGILLDRKNSTNFIKTSKWYSIIDVNTIPDNIRNKGDYYYLKKTNQPDLPLIDLVSKHTWVDLKSYIKNNNSNSLGGSDISNEIDIQITSETKNIEQSNKKNNINLLEKYNLWSTTSQWNLEDTDHIYNIWNILSLVPTEKLEEYIKSFSIDSIEKLSSMRYVIMDPVHSIDEKQKLMKEIWPVISDNFNDIYVCKIYEKLWAKLDTENIDDISHKRFLYQANWSIDISHLSLLEIKQIFCIRWWDFYSRKWLQLHVQESFPITSDLLSNIEDDILWNRIGTADAPGRYLRDGINPKKMPLYEQLVHYWSNKILDKLPTYQGIVYRWVRLSIDELSKTLWVIKEWSIIQDSTIPNFSPHKEDWKSFSNWKTLFVIKSNNGRLYYEWASEPHVLYKANTPMRVAKIESNKDWMQNIVYLEEVDNISLTNNDWSFSPETAKFND